MSLRAWLTRQVSSGKREYAAAADKQQEGKEGHDNAAASQPREHKHGDQQQGEPDQQADQATQARISLKDRLKTHATKGPQSAGSASLKNRLKRHAKPMTTAEAKLTPSRNAGDDAEPSGRADDDDDNDDGGGGGGGGGGGDEDGDNGGDRSGGGVKEATGEPQHHRVSDTAFSASNAAVASSAPSCAEVEAAHPIASRKAGRRGSGAVPRNGVKAVARKAERKPKVKAKAEAKPSQVSTKMTETRRKTTSKAESQPPLPTQEPVAPFLIFSAKHRRRIMKEDPKLTYLGATQRLREMYNAQPAGVRRAVEKKYQKQLKAWKRQQAGNKGGEENETDILVRETKPPRRRVTRKSSSSGTDEGSEEEEDGEEEEEEEGESSEEKLPAKKTVKRRERTKRGPKEEMTTSKRDFAAAKRKPKTSSSKAKSDALIKPAKKPKTLDNFLQPRDPSQPPAFPPKQNVPVRKKKFLSRAEREQLARERMAETQRKREERQQEKEGRMRAKEAERQKKKEEQERERQKKKEEQERERQKKKEEKRKMKQKEQEQRKRQQQQAAGPQEDEDFNHNRRLPPGRKPPTRLQADAFTQAMTVMEFVTNFHKGLPAADRVKSLSIEKLESVLFDAEDSTECNAILANMLIALLEIDDGPCATNVDIGCGIDLADVPLNKETASEVLHKYLQLMPGEYMPRDFDDVIEVLSSGDFSMLSAEQKVRVLAFLCNQHLDNDHVVEVLEDARESIAEKRSKRFRLKRDRAAAARTVKGTKGGRNPQMKQQIESDEALARRLAGLSNTRTSIMTDAEKELMKVEEELERVDTQLKDLQFTWGSRCVGRDRDFNHYYVFTCMHGLYRCKAPSWSPLDDTSGDEDEEACEGDEEETKKKSGSTTSRPADEWRVYITKSELEDLLETLDTRGRREKALKAEVQRLLSQEYLTYLSPSDVAEVEPSDEDEAAATRPPKDTSTLDEKLKQQTRDDVRDTFTSLVEQGIDTVADVGDAISEAASYADLGACVLKMLQRIDDQWLQEPLGPAEKPSELHQEFAALCNECKSASQVQVVNHLLYNSIQWDAADTQRRSARLQRYPSHTARSGRTTRRAATVAKQRQREMFEAWEAGEEGIEGDEGAGPGDTEASDSEEEGGDSNSIADNDGDDDDADNDEEDGGTRLRRSTRNATRRFDRRRAFSPPREIQGVAVHTSHTVSSSRGGRAVKEMQCCEAVLKSLRKCEHAWPFLTPVTEKEDPDYVKSVEHPMDFETIMTQLDARQYADAAAFAADVQRVVDCSLEYYHADTDEYASALAIEKEFQRLWRGAFGHRHPLPESSVKSRGGGGSPGPDTKT